MHFTSCDCLATGLLFLVVAANSLVKRDLFSLPNPFAVISVDAGQTQQTTVLKKTLTPYWNESFDMSVLVLALRRAQNGRLQRCPELIRPLLLFFI